MARKESRQAMVQPLIGDLEKSFLQITEDEMENEDKYEVPAIVTKKSQNEVNQEKQKKYIIMPDENMCTTEIISNGSTDDQFTV